MKTIYKGPDLGYKIANLDFGKTYYFAVRAQNSVGFSEWSDAVLGKTMMPPPGPPKEIDAQVIGTELKISWSSSDSNSSTVAECIGYELEISRYSKPKKQIQAHKNLKHNEKPTILCRKSFSPRENSYIYQMEVIQEALVRVRAIGGGASGHGEWSKQVKTEITRDIKNNKIESNNISESKDDPKPLSSTNEKAQGKARPRVGTSIFFVALLQHDLRLTSLLLLCAFI